MLRAFRQIAGHRLGVLTIDGTVARTRVGSSCGAPARHARRRASLPLMIYFTQSNLRLRHILTSEVIAVEVVRTLVGSIGLIASVPITTALAAFVVTRSRVAGESVELREGRSP